MNDDTKRIAYIVVAAIAVLGAGFSIYQTVTPPKEVSIGSLPITKEGSPANVQQPTGPGKESEVAMPDAGDALSGAPSDATTAGQNRGDEGR